MQYYGDLLRRLQRENHTEICRFFVKTCLQQVKQYSESDNEKRFFMMCAVSANDSIHKFLAQQKWKATGFWQHRLYFSSVKKEIPYVVKAYLSCLLLVLGKQKSLILQKTGLTETLFIQKWELLFQYDVEDKHLFNEFCMIVQELNGRDILFSRLSNLLYEKLKGKQMLAPLSSQQNNTYIQEFIGEDAYIITCRLQEMI